VAERYLQLLRSLYISLYISLYDLSTPTAKVYLYIDRRAASAGQGSQESRWPFCKVIFSRKVGSKLIERNTVYLQPGSSYLTHSTVFVTVKLNYLATVSTIDNGDREHPKPYQCYKKNPTYLCMRQVIGGG